MSHHHDGDVQSAHHQHVSQTEHRILDHISHNHSHAEIYKELNHLRAEDARTGHNFHHDLQNINRYLHSDLAKHHLPSMSIEEHGRNYSIKAHQDAEHRFSQLPAPVRHAMHHYASEARHHHLSPNQGHFARPEPSDNNSDDTKPGPNGQPLDKTEASPSKSGFGKALLDKLHLPVTDANLAFLDAWQKAEGGSADNPFNTTQSAPGAHVFNSAGVKRYPSMEVGIDATAKTLSNGYYGEILKAMQEGQNAHKAAVAVSHTPWGTGKGVARLV